MHAVSPYLMIGVTVLLKLNLRMSRFIINFGEIFVDQPPGSVVVLEGCQATEVPGSILGGYLIIFLLL